VSRLLTGRRGRAPLPAAMRWTAAAWVLSSTADSFVVFTLFWLAGPQGWTGAQTALVVLATRVPSFLGGVLGGRAVDRFGSRGLLGLDAVVRAVLMAGFVVSGLDGRFGLASVLVLGGLAGSTVPVSYAAARTLTPRLVSREQLGSANALLGLGEQLPLLLSAALVGPALELFGVGVAFLVPALMLAVVAVIAWRLKVPTSTAGTAAAREPDPEQEARSPWRTPGVTTLVALSVAYYATYGPFEPVLPWFVRGDLSADAIGYSVLWTVFGVGALATLPLAGRLAQHRPGLVNALGATLWGLVTVPLVLCTDVGAAAVVFLVSGAVWGPYSAIEATALQEWAHPSQHGRLFGLQRALLQSATPLGAALGSLALDVMAPATILAVSTLGCTAAGLAALSRPRIRQRSSTIRSIV
jgi:predicted MFS family arabinose efflux permease